MGAVVMSCGGTSTTLPFSFQSAASCFYILISAASYTVFGEGIEEDILKNIHPVSMQPLLGTTQVGGAASFTLRTGSDDTESGPGGTISL